MLISTMKCGPVILAILALAAPVCFAQVTATQQGPEFEYFTSPMLLEFPLPAITHAASWKDGIVLRVQENLKRYVCDGVSIQSLFIESAKPRRGNVKLRFNAILKNVPGHDKLVNVRFEIVRDGKPVAPAVRIQNADIEEGKSPKHKVVEMLVPVAELEKEGPEAVVRIRLAATDH